MINPSISEEIYREIRSGCPPIIQDKNSGKRTGKKTATNAKPQVRKITKVIIKKKDKKVVAKKIAKVIPKLKIPKMNLRGKVLDLRKMGVINNKRIPAPTTATKGKQSAKPLPASK